MPLALRLSGAGADQPMERKQERYLHVSLDIFCGPLHHVSQESMAFLKKQRSCFCKLTFVLLKLDLWQLSDSEWLLALRQPERHKYQKRRAENVIVQLSFPEMDNLWKGQAL